MMEDVMIAEEKMTSAKPIRSVGMHTTYGGTHSADGWSTSTFKLTTTQSHKGWECVLLTGMDIRVGIKFRLSEDPKDPNYEVWDTVKIGDGRYYRFSVGEDGSSTLKLKFQSANLTREFKIKSTDLEGKGIRLVVALYAEDMLSPPVS